MATSGTVGQTVVQVDDLIGTAVRRAGALPAQVALEQTLSLSRSLFLLLTDLANSGITLWTVVQELQALYPYQNRYELPAGRTDVLTALFRRPTRLEAETIAANNGGTPEFVADDDFETVLTNPDPDAELTFDFGSGNEVVVGLVGILPGTPLTANPHSVGLEVSNDGVVWRSVHEFVNVTWVDRQWVWTELTQPLAGRYFRLVERTTDEAQVYREVYLAQDWYEVEMARLNRDTYAALPQKRAPTDQPLQYWLDKQTTPVVVAWPTPNEASRYNMMNLFDRRHVQDVGALGNTLEVPQRWLPYVQAELTRVAFYELPPDMVDKTREAWVNSEPTRLQMNANAEERDKAPIQLIPNIRGYTR